MQKRRFSRRSWKYKAITEWENTINVPIRAISSNLFDIDGLIVNRKMCKDRGDRKFWFGYSVKYLDYVDDFIFLCQGWGWFALPQMKIRELSKITTISHGQYNFNIYGELYLPGNGERIDISKFHNRNILE